MSSHHSATHSSDDAANDSGMDGSFMVVDPHATDGASSINLHMGSTNRWATEDGMEGHTWSPTSSGSDDFHHLPAAAITKLPTPSSSVNITAQEGADELTESLSQSASLKASAATSQWGEESLDDVKPPTSPGPVGARTPPAEYPKDSVPRSPKLVSSFGSTKFCTSANPPPRSACTTKGEPSSSDLVPYDTGSDWVWFTVGAITVVGAMLAGQQFYRYIRTKDRLCSA